MKALMISIQPKWCASILSGEKTIEVRKTRPEINLPFKCYIYCTKGSELWRDITGETWNGIDENEDMEEVFRLNPTLFRLNGKVIGEFVCDKIEKFTVGTLRCDDIEKAACLTYAEMIDYFYKPNELDGNTAKFGYAWHITDLKIYDEPKEVGAFNHLNKCPNARQDEYDGTWYCEEVDGENAVVDKTKQFPYDEECIYFDCPSCGGENYENEEYAFCMCNGYKPLTKPPQSWCYCEEVAISKTETTRGE